LRPMTLMPEERPIASLKNCFVTRPIHRRSARCHPSQESLDMSERN
jgi:hypothetical protein